MGAPMAGQSCRGRRGGDRLRPCGRRARKGCEARASLAPAPPKRRGEGGGRSSPCCKAASRFSTSGGDCCPARRGTRSSSIARRLMLKVSRHAHRIAETAQARAIDAPVSGGVTGATARSLTFMCGGNSETFQIAKPFLEKMGARILHCGGPGLGQAAKLCNNLHAGRDHDRHRRGFRARVEDRSFRRGALRGRVRVFRAVVVGDELLSRCGPCSRLAREQGFCARFRHVADAEGSAPRGERRRKSRGCDAALRGGGAALRALRGPRRRREGLFGNYRNASRRRLKKAREAARLIDDRIVGCPRQAQRVPYFLRFFSEAGLAMPSSARHAPESRGGVGAKAFLDGDRVRHLSLAETVWRRPHRPRAAVAVPAAKAGAATMNANRAERRIKMCIHTSLHEFRRVAAKFCRFEGSISYPAIAKPSGSRLPPHRFHKQRFWRFLHRQRRSARPAKKEAADRQRPKFREEMPKESTRRVEARAVAKLCSIRWSRD